MEPLIPPVFLITGASGFVGSFMCRHLASSCNVTGAYHSNPVTIPGCTMAMLDITDRRKVRIAVEKARPTHIIHAAAISSPDICENNQQMAWDVNYCGTGFVLEAAAVMNSRMVFISTDLVFDGMRGNYTETDQPNPLNIYSRTKFYAEQSCMKNSKNCIVIRITLQYGFNIGNGSTFSDWILERLKKGRDAPLFTDQFRTPSYIEDTARGLELAALHGKAGELYHLTGPEKISRYDFGKKLAATFRLPEHLLKPCSMDENPGFALRPRDVSLCGKKFADMFCFTPGNIQQGFDRMMTSDSYNQR